MLYNTTPIPNEFFKHLPTLTLAEIRVLLVVIRQTFGWMDSKTHMRKVKDRMTYSYLLKKTGLYRSALPKAIQGLVEKQLLIITDIQGTLLHEPHKRRGKPLLFYQFRQVSNMSIPRLKSHTTQVSNLRHNKRNYKQKKNLQKKEMHHFENVRKLQEIQTALAEQKRIDWSSDAVG
ncbi:MAG: hypothetical protein K1X55_17050 [Chitinophagales bacterium]|nr:hypothetical protein [Chitinophagales bacterium]